MTAIVLERRHWLAEFWNAFQSYNFWKSRCITNRELASQRMTKAVDELAVRGAIKEGWRLPTMNEAEGRVPPGGAYVEPFRTPKP